MRVRGRGEGRRGRSAGTPLISAAAAKRGGRVNALFEKLVGFGKTSKLDYKSDKDREMGFAQDKMNIRTEAKGEGQKFQVTFKGANDEDVVLDFDQQ